MSLETAEGALRDALDELARGGEALRARSRSSIASSLADAWERIADPERALGRDARERLPASTGLTLPMVAWALSTTLGDARSQLAALASRMEPPTGAIEAPPDLGALLLAGNVFTACVQPLSIALLARVPILVKASSADDAMPRLFAEALEAVDPELAAACLVLSLPRGAPTLEATLLHRAGVLSVYGSDETLTSLRGRVAASTAFVGHGHGLGLAWVARGQDLDAAARALALDVAAYDQRGCMSPHAIGIERGADVDFFARALAGALDELSRSLPRGALPTDVGAAQVQWRGVAAARGALLEGDGWAVSVEGDHAPRVSPGWRNVMLFEAASASAFGLRAGSLGAHLKALGVAGDLYEIASALPPGVSPRICRAGTMQTPSLLAYADGLPPWEGWRRFSTIEP